jgi:hypothetical protein
VEECGPCPVFASFTLAFASQLRKRHGKTSVRLRETSVKVRLLICLTQHYHVQVPNTVAKVAVPWIDQAARISKYTIVALPLESTLQWVV